MKIINATDVDYKELGYATKIIIEFENPYHEPLTLYVKDNEILLQGESIITYPIASDTIGID